jgi:hypothetical protein
VDGRTPDSADFVAQRNQDEVCGGAVQKAAIDCTLATGAVLGAATLAYGTAGAAAMIGSALGVVGSLTRCHEAVNAAVEQCGGGS